MKTVLDRLSAPQQKSLALGILLLALTMVLSITVLPALSRYIDNTHERQRLRKQLGIFQQIALTKNNYLKQMQRLQSTQPDRKFYLKSKTANLASSELIKLIQKAVRRQNVEVQSTRNVKANEKKSAANVDKVAIQVVMRGNINALQRVLYDLEMQQPFLFIDRTYVRSRTIRRSAKKKAVEGELDIQLVVAGYIRGVRDAAK